jgi:CRP/FNR family cyclic AMP-dependent transcriptional regulator
MAKAATISRGATTPLFLGLEESGWRELSAHATIQSFPRNSVVINEGDETDSIFFIRSGRVKVFLHDESGREVVLNVQEPGEYFGELALDQRPRSASVMTLEPSQFLIVRRADFKDFLGAHPDFAMRLISRFMDRVRVLTENVRSLALMDVYGRVARLLLELAVGGEGKLVVTQELTQKDIAARVGASPEMVSRIFKELVAGGYITVEGKKIAINRDLPRRW